MKSLINRFTYLNDKNRRFGDTYSIIPTNGVIEIEKFASRIFVVIKETTNYVVKLKGEIFKQGLDIEIAIGNATNADTIITLTDTTAVIFESRPLTIVYNKDELDFILKSGEIKEVLLRPMILDGKIEVVRGVIG